MPKKLDDCVAKVTKSLKKKNPDWDEKKLTSSAFAICNSSLKKAESKFGGQDDVPDHIQVDKKSFTETVDEEAAKAVEILENPIP